MSEQQAGILTPEQVAAIAARADAATPGPWRSHDCADEDSPWCGIWVVDMPYNGQYSPRISFGDMENTTGQDLRNADFVAAARDDVPALVASHEALMAETERSVQQDEALLVLLAAALVVFERMMAGDTRDDWYTARDKVREALRAALGVER